jgi:23S rRNA (guanine2445-N2)-methyltransferase / 23S rRNA (guanine2069-N7)-methyltransferase
VALRTKDAIVDRLRERWGERPDVDVERPALRVHVLVGGSPGPGGVAGGAAAGGEAQLSLDLSGEPLHRRGYRAATGAAPLKENVAAAMLLRSGWPAVAAAGPGAGGAAGGETGAAGTAFVDPMCGAGTLLVEAAWIAGDVAPGLLRAEDGFGFRGWRGHDGALWASLRAEAERRRQAGRGRVPPLLGSDADARAIERARAALVAAGVAGVALERRDVGAARPPHGVATGLVATNAPYGHRLGDADSLRAVYRRLGEALKARFDGWSVALLTADAALAGELRLRAAKRNALWNGAIRCELLQYRIGRGSIPGR